MNFIVKSKIWLLLVLFPIFSQAHTNVQFFLGDRVIVNISGKDAFGNVSDDDAANLYALMNVVPQNSPMGLGKGIRTNDRDMNFSCGTAPGRGPFCSIEFNPSSRLRTNPGAKSLNYLITDAEAVAMSKKWFIKYGKLDFISTDRLFKLHIEQDAFQIEVSGN